MFILRCVFDVVVVKGCFFAPTDTTDTMAAETTTPTDTTDTTAAPSVAETTTLADTTDTMLAATLL